MTMPSPQGQRIAPAGPAGAYDSYSIVTPLKTHFRAAKCEEVGCPRIEHGFQTTVDESSDLGQKQAHYIRQLSGRAFAETRDMGMTVFTFPPGQQCFEQHRIRLERPERYFKRPGDWRGNPTGRPAVEHTNPEHWVEEFAENQDRLARQIERG